MLTTRRISIRVLPLRNEGESIVPDARFGGSPRANDGSGSGELTRSELSAPASKLEWLSLETRLGGGGVTKGGRLLEDGVRWKPGMAGEGSGEATGRGLGGAMIPWEVSRRGFGRRRGSDSSGNASKRDLNSEPRWGAMVCGGRVVCVGVSGTPEEPAVNSSTRRKCNKSS